MDSPNKQEMNDIFLYVLPKYIDLETFRNYCKVIRLPKVVVRALKAKFSVATLKRLPLGKVRVDWLLPNGWRYGVSVEKYAGGTLSCISPYIDDLKCGTECKWNVDGKKVYECRMRKGRKCGREVHWYPNGQIKYDCFWVSSRRQGRAVSWYPDGHIYSQIYYLDDRKHGSETFFDCEGAVDSRNNYHHGRNVVALRTRGHTLAEQMPNN